MYICGNINGKKHEKPTQNLTNILKIITNLVSANLMKKMVKWSEYVTWKCLEN
jgi:hypothetical protein